MIWLIAFASDLASLVVIANQHCPLPRDTAMQKTYKRHICTLHILEMHYHWPAGYSFRAATGIASLYCLAIPMRAVFLHALVNVSYSMRLTLPWDVKASQPLTYHKQRFIFISGEYVLADMWGHSQYVGCLGIYHISDILELVIL